MSASRSFSDQEIIDVYEQSIEKDNFNAKTYYELARFYDSRIESTKENVYSTLKNLGRALLNSRKFDHLAFPRFITLWLNSNFAVGEKKIFDLVGKFVDRCSEAQSVNHLSQLISRIGHPNPADFSLLEKLLIKIMQKYSEPALWKLGSVIQSFNHSRKSRAECILSKFKARQKDNIAAVTFIVIQKFKFSDFLRIYFAPCQYM